MAELINPKLIDKAFASYKPNFNYIADEILTKVPVDTKGGLYSVYDMYSLKPEDDIVSGSGTREVEDAVKPVGQSSYATVERGLKAFIKDSDRKDLQEAGLFDLLKDKVGSIKEKLLLNKEIRVASLISNNGNSMNPSVKWDGENPTIEKDIRTAISNFEDYAGIQPNTIIIPKPIWEVMVMDSTLRDVWKIIPAIAEAEKIKLSSLLKVLFDNFETILIPNAKKDTTKKGKSANLSYIWGSDDIVMLYTVKTGTTDTFTWGAEFKYQDFKSKQWRVEDPEGVYVKTTYAADEQVVCANAIYKISDVLS